MTVNTTALSFIRVGPNNYLFYCVNCVNLETNQFTCIHLIHLIIIFTTNIFYDKGLIIIKF